MYEIRKASASEFAEIKAFLNEVPSIDDISEEILNNASILYLDNKIFGMISFESFFNYALIRYFVFKRNVDELVVKELFSSVEKSVVQKDIEYIFSLVNQDDIYNLFEGLDFKEIDKENVFIEEERYIESKFKDTKLMLKKVI